MGAKQSQEGLGDRRVVVVVGAENAGKSALRYQLAVAVNEALTESEKREMHVQYRWLVHRHIGDAARLAMTPTERSEKIKLRVLSPRNTPMIRERLSSDVNALAYAGHFYADLGRVTTADYVPMPKDCLATVSRSVGVREDKFTYGGQAYQLYDTGGSRGESRKWPLILQERGHIDYLIVVVRSSYAPERQEDLKQHVALCLMDINPPEHVVVLYNLDGHNRRQIDWSMIGVTKVMRADVLEDASALAKELFS